MVNRDVNRYPIQLLVNYWETRPSLFGGYLDDLLRRGVTSVTTFVPWQAVESDISHSLPRFLQAICERKMTVSLILTPELGVHYPNSGLPRDLISKPEHQAKDENGTRPLAYLPPNSFPLPSFFSPDFSKRYYSFLNRMDGMLADLAKATPALIDTVRIYLSGSLWKYYRSARFSAFEVFGGPCADYSNSASLAYRQQLDSLFNQREFWDGGDNGRWKSPELDVTHRKWFQQQSENVFRTRSMQQVRKKSRAMVSTDIELFTPEADPSLLFSRMAQTLGGACSSFTLLSRLMDEYALRTSGSVKMIHWTSMGDFAGSLGDRYGLTDSERQFLILKSLLLFGAQGGALLIDAAEWFALSNSFRARAETYARYIAQGDLQWVAHAAYLTPHLWSRPDSFCENLNEVLDRRIHIATAIDWAIAEDELKLLVLDPQLIVTREMLLKLAVWSKKGGVVAFSQNALLTEPAKIELQKLLNSAKRIEVNLGVPHRIYGIDRARWVVFNDAGTTAEGCASLARALVAIAEIDSLLRVENDSQKFDYIALEKRGQGHGLFVLNATSQKKNIELFFDKCRSVSDLSVALATPEKVDAVEAEHLSLEVPSNGVLPLALGAQLAPALLDEGLPVKPLDLPPEQAGTVWS